MESCVINHVRRHLLFVGYIFPWKDIYCCCVINRVLEYICYRWLYFSMESHVINRVRRQLLSLAIFSMESHVINRIRRQLLLLAIFSNGNSCNKSY